MRNYVKIVLMWAQAHIGIKEACKLNEVMVILGKSEAKVIY